MSLFDNIKVHPKWLPDNVVEPKEGWQTQDLDCYQHNYKIDEEGYLYKEIVVTEPIPKEKQPPEPETGCSFSEYLKWYHKTYKFIETKWEKVDYHGAIELYDGITLTAIFVNNKLEKII